MFRPNSERKLVNVGQQTSSPLITGALPPWRSKMTGRKTLGILGKKLGMTQLFRDDGVCVPVTVVQAGPCKVTQVKNVLAGEHPEGHRSAHNNKGKKIKINWSIDSSCTKLRTVPRKQVRRMTKVRF